MAISLLSLGDAVAAEREIAHAGELAPPSARGLVELLVALVLQRTGRLDAALSAYGRSLTRLRRDGDRRATWRGSSSTEERSAPTRAPSRRPSTTWASPSGSPPSWTCGCWSPWPRTTWGSRSGRRGDVPAALAAFDRAEAAYASQGDPPRLVAALASDRCEVFLTVGLARDATLAAERALTLLGDAGDATHRAEARLLLARARLAQSDLDGARREAEAAAAAFRSGAPDPVGRGGRLRGDAGGDPGHRRRRRAPVGRHAHPHSAHRPSPRGAGLAGGGDARAHVPGAGRSGAGTPRGRAAGARRRRECTGPRVGAAPGGGVARHRPAPPRRRRPVRRQACPPAGAGGGRRAPSRAWRPPSSGPAPPPREPISPVSACASRWRTARPLEVLRWAERWRAGTLRLPSVAPPEDEALTTALHDLREARSVLRDATLEGEPSADLATRVTRLEAKVRNRTMQAGAAALTAATSLDVAGLRERLHDSSLVELVALEGRLLAVTLAGGRAQLHDLAPSRADRPRGRLPARRAPPLARLSRTTSTGPTERPAPPEPPPRGSTTWCSRR